MSEVASHFEGGDCGVVGCACELEAAADYGDSTVEAFGGVFLEGREDFN